jgi:hypothetical protein
MRRQPATRLREALVPIAAILVALAAIVAGLRWFTAPAEPEVASQAAPAAPAPAASRPSGRAVIVGASAYVERSTAGGGWVAARAGDVLSVPDALRTGDGGTAEVALAHGSRVVVAERSEVSVRELSDAVERVGLVRGRVAVEHRPDGERVLRVESERGDIAVTAPRGEFGVVAGPGSLGVAAVDGSVKVESAGAVVEVPPGHETAAWHGQAPLRATRLPRQLLLRVANAMQKRRASVCAVVQGATDPASEVRVDGERVEVAPDGAFLVRVPRHGRREVEVLVRDASGRVERRLVACDEPEVSRFEVQWDAH